MTSFILDLTLTLACIAGIALIALYGDLRVLGVVSGTFIAYSAISACIGFVGLRNELNRVEQWRRGGWIYIFSDIGQIIPTVKIGLDASRESRINSHATAAPYGVIIWSRFRVRDRVYAEGVLKRRYSFWRLKHGTRTEMYQATGQEWFRCIPGSKMFWEIILLRVFGV